jgi:hypothetical protein
MSEWRCSGYRKLQEQSIHNDNYGFFKHNYPLYEIRLTNKETGVSFWGNDLQLKKNKKNKVIEDFEKAYWDYYNSGLLTISSCVVNAEDFNSVSEFIDTKKRLLKKKNIKILGYVSVLDIGETLFKPHYHILLATTKMTEDDVLKFLNDKGKKRYSAEFLKTKKGMQNYLNKKELYSKNKKGRSYTKSRKFESLLTIKSRQESKVKKSPKSKIKTLKKLSDIFKNNRKIVKQSKTVKLIFNYPINNLELIVKNIYEDKILRNHLFGYFSITNNKSTIIYLQIYLPKLLSKNVKEKYQISNQRIKEHFDYQEYKIIEDLIYKNAVILKSKKFQTF